MKLSDKTVSIVTAEYEALDARCEAWTESEVKIGTWATR
jgi:hypothetical protein